MEGEKLSNSRISDKPGKGRLLLHAAIGLGMLFLAACGGRPEPTSGATETPSGDVAQVVEEQPVEEAAFKQSDLSPWVAAYSSRPGRETRVVDLGTGRVIGRVNFAENDSKCKPHHFTSIRTDTPHAGFYGIQTCRSSSETFILEYAPNDPNNPAMGGEFRIKENLMEKYGIPSNHHAVMSPDGSMWAIADDQHDVLSFISTKEPYEPVRVYHWRWDDETKTSTPVEIKPGPDGKYDIPKPEAKFGAHRNDYGTWTADGRWFIEGTRNIGVFWAIDGKTLDIVHAINTGKGGTAEPVDPSDLSKGVRVEKVTTNHGAGVTNDSKYLLVNDLRDNSTIFFDITDTDPRNWKEHKRIAWPTEDKKVNPYHMNFSVDGSKAFISMRSYDVYKAGTGAIGVVDLNTLDILKVIETPGFIEPHGIAVTPDNKFFIQAFSGWDTTNGGHVVFDMETLEPVLAMPTSVAAHEFVIIQASKITNGC